MPDYIKKLISEGEHQMLDFKFEISDSRKIARTLVAFANTYGGRLLIGVKDNGSIAGVRSEEEFYMVEGAAKLYCKPEIPMNVRRWKVEGRNVMEVIIQPGAEKPYRALDEKGHWRAYIRQRDENFRASRVTCLVWQYEKSEGGTVLNFGHSERILLNYLGRHPWITLTGFRRIAGINKERAEHILANFIVMGILEAEYIEQDIIYRLQSKYEKAFGGAETI